MEKYYAFGKLIPQEIIEELLLDGIKKEELTTEFFETYFEYEKRDNE